MALDENKILEVLNNYNLTSEEMVQFNRERPNDGFADEAALRGYITKMRRENALKTAEKDAGDISFDELQVAWETVKDAKEGDELYTSKQALESKSEEIVKNFAEAENPAISMLIAPEMSEWLKINDSRTNISDLEKARNSKLANKLQAYYNQYDAENNIGDLTPDRLQKIDNAYIKISEHTKDFDPFEAGEDGKLKHPEFADIAECYAKMQILGKDGKPINDEEKKQYQISMIKNAMLSAKRKMSLDPNVDPANIDMKRFKELMNETMEEDILIAVAGEKITRSQNKKAKFRDLLTKSKSKDTLEVKEENINMALGVRFQLTDGVERRISQKSGIRNRLALIKQKKKEFEEKHPEMAKTLKTVKNLAWNLGKGMAIGYVTGGIGIFAYGAIMGYKKIKEMNRRRKEENKKTGEKVGFFKWLKKNPKEMVSLGFSVVSVGLSAMGVAVDTNLGAFGNWTGINNMIQDVSWLQSAKEFVGLENVSKATVMSAKMVNALGAMSHEGISAFAKRWNETKGEKGWKRVLKSTNASLGSILGAAGMFAGSALNGITPEEQSHSSSATNETTDWSKPRDWSANEYKPPLSFGENQEDIKIPLREGAEGDNQEPQNDIVTEVKSFDDVFQGETKVNLERAVNAAPATVLEHLKAQGIFSEDTKFMSSPKLMEEINTYYASHPEADPQVLADIVNNPENQAQFIHDMKVSNAEQAARRAAIQAAKERLQGVYHDGDTPVNPTEGNPTEDYVYDSLTDAFIMSDDANDVSNIINSEENGTPGAHETENTVEQTTPSTEETRAETKPLENSAVIKAVNYDFIEAKNWEYDLGFIPPTEHFSEELWRDVESKTYVDPVTHKFVCGGTIADSENHAENLESIALDRLAKSHSIYQAISAKQAGGLALTENEGKFMAGHQAALAEHNLKIDKDGNVVFDEERFKDKLGLHDKESIKIFKHVQKGSNIKTHIGNNSEFVDPSWKWLKSDNGR